MRLSLRSSQPRRRPARDHRTSTFTLTDKERAEDTLKKAGHIALDCPISGTGVHAKVKHLVVYPSGDSKSVAKDAGAVSRVCKIRP
jgi:L-threonate 2-dehydrogenase